MILRRGPGERDPYSSPVQELHDAPLAPLTTFRLGGPATRLVTATTDDEVIAVVREADTAGTPLLIIGGGSNLVIGDKGFDGTAAAHRDQRLHSRRHRLELAAGEIWTDAVARTVEAGLAGVECLAGIPGSAGATPIQNVGAYGQEVADTITEVVAYDRTTARTVTLPNADCAFSYRHSRFKAAPGPLCGAAGPLRAGGRGRALRADQVRRDGPRPRRRAPGERVPAATARDTVLKLRAGKGMVLDPEDHDTWSAGSFFTNPILDRAGVRRASWPACGARLGDDGDPARLPGGRRAARRPPRPG